MALDSNIPLMAKGFDPFDMGEKGVQLGNLLTQQKTTQTMQDLYNQTQGDPVKMMDLAKGSKMYALIAPQIQQQEMAKQKLLLDNQKTQSEIYKNTGDATKSMTQSQGFGLDNAGKTLSAMQTAIGYGAQSGDKNAVFQALDMARSSGLLTPEQYKTEASRVSGFQSPNDVKQYALSSQIANSKDPAQYLVQTANNVANNATTERGQDITSQTTQRGQDMTAQTANNQLNQNGQQFNQTMAFKQQQQYFEQNKPQQFIDGADGSKYALFADGRGMKVIGQDGQPIKVQPKGDNPQADEKNRLDRLDIILPEVKKLLPKATNSYAGKGVDIVGNIFGMSTDGQQATVQLKTLAGQLVSMMPKMSGPQSDKDVAMYKEMAGNLADDTLPIKARMAALESIESLNAKYRELNDKNSGKTPTALVKTPTSNESKPNSMRFFD